MAFGDLVQSASNQGDPASATFGSTPSNGNIIVVAAMERSGQADAANYTISGSGWTPHVGLIVLNADTTFRRSLRVWSKIVSGGSEPTNIQVDDGTANTKGLLIAEYDAAGQTVTFDTGTAGSSNTNTSNATSLATGSTSSVSAGDLFIVGIAAIKDSGGSTDYAVTWSTLNLDPDAIVQSANGRVIAFGSLPQIGDAGGTKASTFTADAGSDSNSGLMAALLVFRVGTPAPPPDPEPPHALRRLFTSIRPRPFAPGNAR